MASLFKSIQWKIAQKAELQWWKNYLAKKEVQDYLSWKQDYWAALLNRLQLSDLNHSSHSILDAGCGPAGMFMMVKNAAVVAIDPLIEEYESRLPHFRKSMYPQVVFKNTTIEALSDMGIYNHVFCLNAINHVSQLEVCIDNLIRSLHSDGTLILSIDGHNYSFLKYLFRLLPGDILHPHQYSLKEYQNMLEKCNMKITQVHCLKREFIFSYFVLVAKKKQQ